MMETGSDQKKLQIAGADGKETGFRHTSFRNKLKSTK
jgi:hypothetical protein